MGIEERLMRKRKKPIVSIIIPTRKRSELLRSRLVTLRKHTPELSNGTAELIVVVDSDDYLSINMKGIERKIVVLPLSTPAYKWNRAAKCALGRWLVTISDDCIPEKDWLKNALKTKNKGFIGLPDGVTGDRNNYFTPLYMATRTWLKKYNGGVLVIPHYKSWYADIETANRAHNSNTYVVGEHSTVTQLHSIFGSAPDDEIYEIGRRRQLEDFEMYKRRIQIGFPDDFEGVL